VVFAVMLGAQPAHIERLAVIVVMAVNLIRSANFTREAD